MRIISDFHDYYDIGLSYGIDPQCVYTRKTEKFRYKHPLARIETVNEESIFIDKVQHVTDQFPNIYLEKSGLEVLATYKVLFCGDIYYGATYRPDPKNSHVEATSYTYESMIREVNKYHSLKEMERLLTKNKHRRRYHGSRGADVQDWDSVYPVQKNSKVMELHIEYGTPIVLVRYDDRYIACSITKNPNLSTIEFYRCLDPYTAFQELSMFISGVMGGQAPPMVKISDKDRFEKHGFDSITSFRKMKDDK